MKRRGNMSTRIKPEKKTWEQMIPSGMTKEEVQELKTAFDLFELDEDQVIVQDLIAEMNKNNFDTRFPAAMAVLNEVEQQGQDSLTFEELLELLALDVRTANEDDQLQQLFRLLDIKGEKSLESDEVRALFREIGEEFTDEEWGKQFERLDQDGDGKFSYNDFLVAVGKDDDDSD